MFPLVWNIWSNHKKIFPNFMNIYSFVQGLYLYYQIHVLARQL